MIAAGIGTMSEAKDNAKTRIFEDGTIITEMLQAVGGLFSGKLQLPFVNMLTNTYHIATQNYDYYWALRATDPTSLYIASQDRYEGNPYQSIGHIHHLSLPSDMPDGVIVNIISVGQNYKNMFGAFHLTAGHIYYGTNQETYYGQSILDAQHLKFKDQVFLRLLSFSGGWYVISVMGTYEVINDNE